MISCTYEDGNKANLRHATVGCIIVENNEILLAKRAAHLSEAGKWCLPGGYVNLDETTSEAAARETLEETGWSIKNLKLMRVNDNPNRPHEDRQNIDFIYIANASEQIGQPDSETAELCWFPLDSLPPDAEIAFDHIESIRLYITDIAGKFHTDIRRTF